MGRPQEGQAFGSAEALGAFGGGLAAGGAGFGGGGTARAERGSLVAGAGFGGGVALPTGGDGGRGGSGGGPGARGIGIDGGGIARPWAATGAVAVRTETVTSPTRCDEPGLSSVTAFVP